MFLLKWLLGYHFGCKGTTKMLSTDFTKQEIVKQAKVLGVALNTMERWITKSVQIAHIERLATGLYRKIPSYIA